MVPSEADVIDTPSLVTTVDDADYLLCIDGDRSWRVPVPPGTELVVGRGTDVGVKLGDAMVSRHHARCTATPDGVRLTDLDSRHGTLVNGERLVGARLLRSGDVITVGQATLVLHRANRIGGSTLVEREALVRRAEDELARARHYHRELAVIVVRTTAPLDAAAAELAVAGRMPPGAASAAIAAHHLAVLAPELDGAAAARLADGLAKALAPTTGPVAVGVACAPSDAAAADALLTAARTAADAAAPGQRIAAADQIPELVAGEHRIVVADPAVAKLYELAARLARSPLAILIEGETGAGKELAAAALHAFARRPGPLVAVNCAAVPEALAEAEWFGYARGAFTGASAAKAGYLEQASGGTLFLDELGELSLALQAKLLRALEAGEITRVGEVTPRPIDLRVVAATNRDLAAEVAAGRFRQDLYFRLGAARLTLPPLRDRPRDLAVLCRRILAEACAALDRPPLRLSVAATWALAAHDWPGNVRELRNVLGYLAAAAPDDATTIERAQLPPSFAAAVAPGRGAVPVAPVAPPPRPALGTAPPVGPGFRSVGDDVRALERGRMVEALRAAGGQQNRAASLIDMPLRTFATKMKRYQITPADWRDPP